MSKCEKLYAEILREAQTELEDTLFTAETAVRISGGQRRLLDQLAYRFAKLQSDKTYSDRGFKAAFS